MNNKNHLTWHAFPPSSSHYRIITFWVMHPYLPSLLNLLLWWEAFQRNLQGKPARSLKGNKKNSPQDRHSARMFPSAVMQISQALWQWWVMIVLRKCRRKWRSLNKWSTDVGYRLSLVNYKPWIKASWFVNRYRFVRWTEHLYAYLDLPGTIAAHKWQEGVSLSNCKKALVTTTHIFSMSPKK